MKTGTTLDNRLSFIFNRRSVRVYAPGAVNDEAVTKMLEAAMAAPSAMAKDPWRYVIVRDPKMLANLAAALPGGAMLSTAACAIVVCGDMEAVLDQQLSFLLQDCSAAIENLLLAACALGIGSCWVGIHPGEGMVRQVKKLLGLPPSITPIAAVSLGVPGEEAGSRTRFNADYVHRERW